MKRILFYLLAFFCVTVKLTAQQKFHIDLNDRADDLFVVTVYPDNLNKENNIFQFASTAPGTYQIMDIGKYVKTFKAYDKSGNEIETDHTSINQWTISSPENIERIEYKIAETWDTQVEENKIFPMAGTSIENDHAVINGHCVFGYFQDKQSDPVYIKINYPEDWLIGTALKQNSDGYYEADNYDQIVDSPIMLGILSEASLKVEETDFNVYTYSKTGMVKSPDIMSAIEDIIKALSDFTEGFPVDRYVLLFHFEDASAGALEHNYSSFYVYKESPFQGHLKNSIRSVVAHEIYHIITPLNIHSELIEEFNFVNPVLSQHLWLYEGVTEWASQIMQLRAGLRSLEGHLQIMSHKLVYNEFFNPDLSLYELSVNSFNLQPQIQMIYQKGAVTAELLDIKLLELSKGKRGLREVINQLADDYGPDKGFDEKNFFEEFVSRTFPEIDDFINRYIKNAEPLPVKEYFEKIGITYYEYKGVDSSRVNPGIGVGVDGDKIIITNIEREITDLKMGDIIKNVNGEEVSLKTIQSIYMKMLKMKIGEEIKITVEREGKEENAVIQLKPQPIKHLFEIDKNAAAAQLELRETWMKNL